MNNYSHLSPNLQTIPTFLDTQRAVYTVCNTDLTNVKSCSRLSLLCAATASRLTATLPIPPDPLSRRRTLIPAGMPITLVWWHFRCVLVRVELLTIDSYVSVSYVTRGGWHVPRQPQASSLAQQPTDAVRSSGRSGQVSGHQPARPEASYSLLSQKDRHQSPQCDERLP